MRLIVFLTLVVLTISCQGTDAGGGSSQSGLDRTANGVMRQAIEADAHYRGVRTIVSLPGSAESDARIAARAFFENRQNGSSVLHLAEEGPAHFKFDALGHSTAQGGWIGGDEEIQIRIDPHGSLSGTGIDPPFKYVFSGKVSPKRFFLRMEMTATESRGRLRAGSSFAYHYMLEREYQSQAKRHSAPGMKQGSKTATSCKRIRWKLKNVMNYSDGTIDSVRVPECMD